MTLEPLIDASPAIQIHVIAALVAFGLGAVTLFRRKGDRRHRISGRIWVAAMLVVAISSMFIHTIRLVGPWSPLHLVSLATIYFVIQAVWQARQGRIDDHRRSMKQLYFFAVIGAGVFTFLPGRHMHDVLFGGSRPWLGVLAIALVALAAGVMLWKSVGAGLRGARQNSAGK